MWINETKGLCSGRTLAHCSSWQLGKLPPSGSHPLPPSASQPANLGFLLVVWLNGEVQTVHVMDPIHPGFAKTVPEQGLLQVVVGKWETATALIFLHWASSTASLWIPGGAEAQPSYLEGLTHPDAGKEVERVHSQRQLSSARVMWQWEELKSHLPRLWTPRLGQWCKLVRPWYPEVNLVFYLSVHSSSPWLRR